MGYEIIITEPAEKDLEHIASYIEEKLYSPKASLDFLLEVEKRVSLLEQMPKKYALVADERLALMGIRKIPVKNYIVFYLVDDIKEKITIIRVLYGKRDWQNLL